MEPHNWKETAWQDDQGNGTTIIDLLIELQDDPIIEIKLADLAHIPSTYIEEHRRIEADLSFPIIIQKKNNKYLNILDGHHRRQKAIDENRTHILAKIYRGEVINESG